MLRHGHLESAVHIMSYLMLKHNLRKAFDQSYLDIDQSNFWDCDWADFYTIKGEKVT